MNIHFLGQFPYPIREQAKITPKFLASSETGAVANGTKHMPASISTPTYEYP